MKIGLLVAAVLATTGGLAATPVAAQERTVVRERVYGDNGDRRVVVRERTTTRHSYRRDRSRRVCRVRYRHGERTRTCYYRRY